MYETIGVNLNLRKQAIINNLTTFTSNIIAEIKVRVLSSSKMSNSIAFFLYYYLNNILRNYVCFYQSNTESKN